MRVVDAQPVEDVHENAFAFGKCFAVGITQDMEAEPFKLGCPPRVGGHRLRLEVLTAVEFDDQMRFNASEVRKIPADRSLAPELVAIELAIAKCLPQRLFRFG